MKKKSGFDAPAVGSVVPKGVVFKADKNGYVAMTTGAKKTRKKKTKKS